MDGDDGRIKVMIVDDQEVIREAFGLLLANDASVDLIGALADGQSAIEMVPVLNPKVVIMDVKIEVDPIDWTGIGTS